VPFDTLGPFSITNGLVTGLKYDRARRQQSAAGGPTALRVDLSGVGMPLPPGLPQITSQPQNRTFVETDNAILSLIALGAAPLSYQWYRDGNALAGEDHRTLRRPSATLADSGDYQVV